MVNESDPLEETSHARLFETAAKLSWIAPVAAFSMSVLVRFSGMASRGQEGSINQSLPSVIYFLSTVVGSTAWIALTIAIVGMFAYHQKRIRKSVFAGIAVHMFIIGGSVYYSSFVHDRIWGSPERLEYEFKIEEFLMEAKFACSSIAGFPLGGEPQHSADALTRLYSEIPERPADAPEFKVDGERIEAAMKRIPDELSQIEPLVRELQQLSRNYQFIHQAKVQDTKVKNAVWAVRTKIEKMQHAMKLENR